MPNTPYAAIVRNGRVCIGAGGKPVIANSAGTALCICGSPGECGVIVGPGCPCQGFGCSNVATSAWKRTFVGTPPAYSYIYNRNQNCCYGPSSGRAYVIDFRNVVILDDQWWRTTVCRCTGSGSSVTCNWTTTGNNAGGGSYTRFVAAGDTLDNIAFTAMAVCPNRVGWPIGGGYGDETLDCENYVGNFLDFGSPPGGPSVDASFDYYRAVRSLNNATCSPGCLRGACCCGEVCYSGTTGDECLSMGGRFGGIGTTCQTLPFPCGAPGTGACCSQSVCQTLTPAQCAAIGGVGFGIGVPCGFVLCATIPGNGACCLPSGQCQDGHTSESCATASGIYKGNGTLCATSTCPAPAGACCLNGTCYNRTAAECAAMGGAFYAASMCQGSVCPSGACCFAPSGTCQDLTNEECINAGGAFMGAGSACSQGLCMGACCSRAPHGGQMQCSQETPESCAVLNEGTWMGFGTPCEAGTCGSFDGGGGGGGGGWMPLFSPDSGARMRGRVRGGFQGGCGGCGTLHIPSPSEVAAITASRNR